MIEQLRYRAKLLVILGVFIALASTGTFVWLHRTPSNDLPITGVTLIFAPRLPSTATLEIESSNGHIENATLTQAKTKGSGRIIKDPQGVRYNIALNEGVYRLKIRIPGHEFPAFTKTATVSDHKVTTEVVNFPSPTKHSRM
jgi:hypothetical protein